MTAVTDCRSQCSIIHSAKSATLATLGSAKQVAVRAVAAAAAAAVVLRAEAQCRSCGVQGLRRASGLLWREVAKWAGWRSTISRLVVATPASPTRRLRPCSQCPR